MKLLTEYVERAVQLEELAAKEPDSAFKNQLHVQARRIALCKTRWGPRDAASESEGKVGDLPALVSGIRIAAAGQGGRVVIPRSSRRPDGKGSPTGCLAQAPASSAQPFRLGALCVEVRRDERQKAYLELAYATCSPLLLGDQRG